MRKIFILAIEAAALGFSVPSQAQETRGITTCIPSSRSRKRPSPSDRALYSQRRKVDNLFAKLKD